jgi:broad specificity phosphatase PhoE
MPSVERRASKILDEYGAAQAELIGKAVVLTDGKAGTSSPISRTKVSASRKLRNRKLRSMR